MGCIHPFLHYKLITGICGLADGTWKTVNISDYVPPQTQYALIYMKNTAAVQYYYNIRPTGSGYNDEPDVGNAPRVYQNQQKYTIIKLNANMEFDIRRSNANLSVYLTGWADGSIHYLDTRVNVTPVPNAAWTATDLSALIPANATGAYFYWVNSVAALCEGGVRENGSVNGTYDTVHRSTKWMACGVDANKVVELYKENANITIYLMGYFVPPMDFLLDKAYLPIAGNTLWMDVDLTGKLPTNNVDFAFVSMYPSAENEGIAPRGGTFPATAYGKQRNMGFVRVDVTCQIKAYSHDRVIYKHYAEGYQETDTARHRLGIDADRPDDYPTSDITYGDTVWGIRWLRKCFIHNGLFWVFYVRQGAGIAGNFYYRTSSDGVIWSDENLLRNTTYFYGEVANIWFDGTKVHVFTKNTPRIYYRSGTPNADGTITWDAVWQVAWLTVGATTVGDHSGAVDSSGYPWVLWCWENVGGGYGAMEIHVNGSQNNDGTWLDLAGYPVTLTGNNYRMGYLVALLNRNMYAIFMKGGSSPTGRFYTQSTDTWTASQPVSTRNALTTYNADAFETWSYSAVVDAVQHVHLVFLDENNNIVYCRRDYHLGVWVASDELVLQAGVPDYATPQIAIDYSTGSLYVYYMESDGHVYMLRRINWVWDANWIDFLDITDVGIGHNASVGDDGCVSVSRRVINDDIIVLVMGDSPRIIRHSVREIDKLAYTWDGVSRPTPWKEGCIYDGTVITSIMPATFGIYDWWEWNDNDINQSRALTMDADYLYIGRFNGIGPIPPTPPPTPPPPIPPTGQYKVLVQYKNRGGQLQEEILEGTASEIPILLQYLTISKDAHSLRIKGFWKA